MAESIKGLNKLQKDFDKISKDLVDDKFLFKVGSVARRNILNRTDKGKDFRGHAFKPYADATKRHREKRGRQVGHVDLQDRRQMLNNIAIKTQAHRDIVKLVFTRGAERQKAFYHTEVGVGKDKIKREFFALDKKTEKEIDDMFDKRLKDLLK